MWIPDKRLFSGAGTLASACVIALALGACSPSDDEDEGSGPAPETSSPESAPPAGNGDPCTGDDFTISEDTEKKPEITVPDDCAAPAEMLSVDVVDGSGTEVSAGNDVDVHYVLVGLSDGEQRDASWDRGQTFTMENAGQAPVIEGWNQGVLGLKEGGRRLLVIPPELGYGNAQGHELENETLVFVIDAVSVS